MLEQLHFIFITQCLVQVVYCQRIQLFPYYETNNCNFSLVKGNDRILMYGKVDFNGNIPASSVVNFEIKRKTETSFQFFCFLQVPEDCDKVFYYCNCFKTDDPKVFKLTLNITATTVNSEADVRTEFVYRETTFFSEIRHLPIVYGSETDVVVVYVNDQVIHFNQTDVSINDTQVTIVSVCREHFADNCKQQLSDLETGTLVKSEKEMVVYNTNIKGRYNFKLKYSVCNIERNISFSITTDTTTDYLHWTTGTNEILIIILSTVLTLVILFCFYRLCKNSSKMFWKRKRKTDRTLYKEPKLLKNVWKKHKTEKKNTDFCFPQDTCGLNVCLKDQIDIADFSSLGGENQDTDPYHFTSDQSKVQSDEVKGPLIGDHETQESEGREADLHKYLVGCKKNPGHRQFIPVETFNLKHLPEGYQDKDVYKYIKCIADLTVRVDVRMSSPDRPKFWSKTTQPYSFYNMSERRNLRTGSGRVWHVNKFQDGVWKDGSYGSTAYTNCWCRKCEGSNSASNVWWEFDVSTATHVVFDDIEAKHTTLRLFYDRDDSPVVSVDKVSARNEDIEYDLRVLNCVTCDVTLGEKLMEMWKHFVNVRKKVFNKHFDSRSLHKLTFIVSHPHGCSKQVSVGQWKDRLEVDGRSKFTYTTCTCPGSAGAPVNCLVYRSYWTWFELVHSGSLKSGLNYSGVGYV